MERNPVKEHTIKYNKCLAFTGGGTAGHIFPGLAIAELLKQEWEGRLIWLGSRQQNEQKWVAESGMIYYPLFSGKWRRYFSLRNFTDFFKIFFGFWQAVWILKKEKPLMLFSKGGFVSIPPVLAARLLRITVYTHESDFDPGLATRLNARAAAKILTAFSETAAYFPAIYQSRLLHTGNPIRSALLKGEALVGKTLVACPPDRPLILILGGSQGALRINQFILSILDALTGRYFVVHQMGGDKFESLDKPNYLPVPFLKEELPHVLAAASLVVSRAGANTLAELSALGKAALLIPLSSSRGDQIRNACFYEQHGAAIVFKEQTGTSAELLDIIQNLLDNKDKLQEMQSHMQKLGAPGAQKLICDLVMTEIKSKGEEYV